MADKDSQRDNNNQPQGNETERAILDNMGFGDEPDTGDDDDVADEPDSPEEQEHDARAQLPAEEDDPAFKLLDLKTGDREPKTKPKKETETAPVTAPVPTGFYKQDNKGNIVDSAGKVIAPTGLPARLFREREHARTQVRQAQHQLQQVGGNLQKAVSIGRELNAQLKAYKEANASFGQMGLQPNEAIEAASFMSRLKKGGSDGIGALKEILTRAATAGIDVASLGVGGGGIDPKAIVDAIRAEIAPVTAEVQNRSQQDRERQEQEVKQRQVWNDAATQTYSFFQTNPDAMQYAPQIEKLLKDERMAGFSLREIWQEIQLHLLRNGGSQKQQRNGNRAPSMPSARRAPNGNRGSDWVGKPAPAGTSQRDIINQLLDHFETEMR